MSDKRALYIEEKIIEAVRRLLSGRVNELLGEMEYPLPLIEFTDYQGGSTVVPNINLSACERTEKERIILQDAYSLNITFALPENLESEIQCYAYAGAIGRALYDDPTLSGVADRTVITSKKYTSPKKSNCGEGWELAVSLRIIVEGMGNAG